MLRLAFDFIITWRETRTRPNAYTVSATDITGKGQCHRTNHPAAHLNALQGNNLTGSVQTYHIQRTPENTDRDRAPGSGKRG